MKPPLPGRAEAENPELGTGEEGWGWQRLSPLRVMVCHQTGTPSEKIHFPGAQLFLTPSVQGNLGTAEMDLFGITIT